MENQKDVIKRDCNQCGDYEYCAFQWDRCTGFIPGDNYVYEKLNKHKHETGNRQ